MLLEKSFSFINYLDLAVVISEQENWIIFECV